jgi:serine/threonine-protein phosphatase 5
MDFAELAKDEGNKFFKEGHYMQACSEYTKAIALGGDTHGNLHVFYSNRAFANIRLENLGLAIADATRSVLLRPDFVKGYYRRGCAYIALMKFKEALKDFQKVIKLNPSDADAQARLKECKKQVQYELFASAIESEKTAKFIDQFLIDNVSLDLTGYKGPVYNRQTCNMEFCIALMEWFKAEKTIPKKFAYQIILDGYQIFKSYPSLVQVPLTGNFSVYGDIHGQFYDLLNIFQIDGLPDPNQKPCLFNGDICDRGSFSAECVLTLFAMKIAMPQGIYIARGNHETRNMNRLYGFQGEIQAKYDENLYNLSCDAFCALPLAHVIGNSVFVVHGGLFSSDEVTLNQIRDINRDCEPGDEGLMTELLWADPMPGNGRAPSKRGVGLSFGPDVTANFLRRNNLQLVIRSHEMKEEGYEIEHNGQLITVFSAPNYCDQMGNKGGIVRLFLEDGRVKFKVLNFDAVPHPDKKAMCYANKALFGPSLFGGQ